MKIKIRNRLSIISILIFGIAVFLVSSASISSENIPAVPQNQKPALLNEDVVSPAVLNASAVLNFTADTLTRIAFATGTTSGTASGSLSSGAVKSYILNAGWNQVMMVSVDSSDDKTYLEIYGQWDGVYLKKFSSASTSWQGWLPRTQAYIVKVYNSSGSTKDYTLSVVIPARIRFAPGAYSGAVYGRGSAAKTISYVLYARSGQTMTATLSSSTVYLSIHGFSGGQSLVATSAAKTSWTGTLPQSQEYIIDAVQNSSWVNFTLTVKII